jgi:hypothetical protein
LKNPIDHPYSSENTPYHNTYIKQIVEQSNPKGETNQKIKAMEEYLKKMTKENDVLRSKIDLLVTNTAMVGNMNNNNKLILTTSHLKEKNKQTVSPKGMKKSNSKSGLTASQLTSDRKEKNTKSSLSPAPKKTTRKPEKQQLKQRGKSKSEKEIKQSNKRK